MQTELGLRSPVARYRWTWKPSVFERQACVSQKSFSHGVITQSNKRPANFQQMYTKYMW